MDMQQAIARVEERIAPLVAEGYSTEEAILILKYARSLMETERE